MELSTYFKSIVDQDRSAVVICDLSHMIIYMNPAARKRYEKHGNLIGKSLMGCHNEKSCQSIERVLEWFKKDISHNIVYTYRNDKENKDVYMIALRDDNGTLIGYYEKHEYRSAETMKLYDID